MADAVIVFPPGWRATDASDLPISGAKIKFFATGTTTPITVYSDQGLLTTLGTEVTCDSGGYPVSGGGTKTPIYIGTASYKVRLTTSADATVWEHDALKGAVTVPATSSTALPSTPMVTRTTTYSALTTDQGKWLNSNPTSASFAVTLLSAVTAGDGFTIGIRHVGTANVVTVRTAGSETLLFSGQTKTAFSLTGKGHGVWLVSDGANWHVTLEAPALMVGNGLPMFLCTDRLTAPPVSPVGGQRYIINGTPTGAWSTLGFSDKDVAEADGNGSWFAYTPAEGWLAWVEDEDLWVIYYGSAWNSSPVNANSLTAKAIPIRAADYVWGYSAADGADRKFLVQHIGGRTLLNTLTASSSATLVDTTSLTSAFKRYEIEFDNIIPATDAVEFRIRLSVDAGASYLATGYSCSTLVSTGGVSTNAQNTTHLAVTEDTTAGIQNTAAFGLSGLVQVHDPSDASNVCHLTGRVSYRYANTIAAATFSGAYMTVGNDIDAIQFLMNSGNIASGVIRIYGVIG